MIAVVVKMAVVAAVMVSSAAAAAAASECKWLGSDKVQVYLCWVDKPVRRSAQQISSFWDPCKAAGRVWYVQSTI